MKVKFALIPVMAVFFSHVTLAAEIFHKTKIDMIYALPNGNAYLGIDIENESCANVNEFYRLSVGEVNVTEEGIKIIYAAALSAAAQQKDVEIVFESKPDGHCYISRLKVFY